MKMKRLYLFGFITATSLGTVQAMDVKHKLVVELAEGQTSSIEAEDFNTLKELCQFGELLTVTKDFSLHLPALTKEGFEALIRHFGAIEEGEQALEKVFAELYQGDRCQEFLEFTQAGDYLGIEVIEKALYGFLSKKFEVQYLSSEKDKQIIRGLLSLSHVYVYFGEEGQKRIQQWPHKIDLSIACKNAAGKGCVELLELFLECGAPLYPDMLSAASHNGCTEVVQLLLDRDCPGIDMQDTMYNGCSPLMKAVSNGHTEVVRALLKKSAQLELTDIWKKTALLIGIDRGRTECVGLLILGGANTDVIQLSDGETLLLWAVNSGNKAVVQWLVEERKAPVDTRNNAGQTALTIASEALERYKGTTYVPLFEEIIEVLKRA